MPRMGKKLDDAYLEMRRQKAIQLLACGKTQVEISKELGVRRQTVNRWVGIYKKQGIEALKKATKRGRKSRLTENNYLQIEEGLQAGPQRFGFPNPLWTTKQVTHLIEILCGVKYHPDHIYRILTQREWNVKTRESFPLTEARRGL